MSGEPGFDDFGGLEGLSGETGAERAASGHEDKGLAGPWFVRFSGRRTGPFDAERLRTLARRGALTRMHALSVDGKSWKPATELRAVFNADGSVVAEGVREVAQEYEPEHPAFGADFPDSDPSELPVFPTRRALGSALVRPAVLCALVLATVMLALPTSRDESGALAWWWSEGPIAIAVRGLCAVTLLVAWVVAFLPPEPARAASVSAVAAVLAGAGALALVPWAPWAVVMALLVPVAALLVALDATGSAGVRMMGVATLVLAPLLCFGLVALGIFWFSVWAIVGMALGVVATAALCWAGYCAFRRRGPNAGGVFSGSVIGATAALGCVFAAAFGGLAGDVPMQGAQGAVSACLVLAFSTISWAAVHEAVESSNPR